MELNREQIIKALECCAKEWHCGICKYRTICKEIKLTTLALIKELSEENEAWQKQLISIEEKSGKAYYELACEVEDLRKLHKEMSERMVEERKIERKLTVRKMQERLIAEFRKDNRMNYYLWMTLDQIAKEMEEGEGNGT